MNLTIFNQTKFISALKLLFKELNVPINYVTDEPTSVQEILKDTYKDNETFRLIDDVYFVGMVDDAAFEGNKSLSLEKIKSDYDGILIFGITLKERPNGLLPTRSQLAEISRSFNREFYYTPVTIVFKYDHHMAFANTERMKYKQEWREGEKAGKVILLRDIDIDKPHSGHERILSELKVPISGSKPVDSFEKLYTYWHEVFSVSVLNKKFYQELSNWYFWATKQVRFPGEPTITDAHRKKAKLEDLLQEHRATNVIRLLTRLLFVWFIKEKKLIPEELFELESLQKDILKEISPYHETGMFKEANKDSVYYKAILQNLFFATLNCPIEGDNLDKRKRGFRGEGYGTHRGIDYLMRYKQHFKNPEKFLEKVNAVVPFLNGGLFECLDDKYNNIYIDGFSDQMTQGENLVVPDYLFFGVEEKVDLSKDYGISNKGTKEAAVKGLINILKSYKFTITENTPIEEDVALDPELLGKVFENLLASYNPETQTTARKQTGSFYTPREIVNYMVDESLIAHLKNVISSWASNNEDLDRDLHVLTSYDSKVPFGDNLPLQKNIITALSQCTIIDPACGSGAFPMGVLQKMVHILQKLDPDNRIWKEVQLQNAEAESKAAFEIEDKLAREERLLEINEAFDQSINHPDYARKLFLIENCIYGIDIQPIATQISKLRFFISLVVEQKVNPEKENFGIRPLPNLETKFVAANTLIGIKKDGGLFETAEVKQLENELKIVRHKIFSLKSKERKIAWREKDELLRRKLSDILKKQGLPLEAAENLAKWDPYDQNLSSPFFDPEWMFGIKDGFDLVIGNPPYGVSIKGANRVNVLNHLIKVPDFEIYYFFIEIGYKLTSSKRGILTYIIPNTYLFNVFAEKYRRDLIEKWKIVSLIDFTNYSLFDSATVRNSVFLFCKNGETNDVRYLPTKNEKLSLSEFIIQKEQILNVSLLNDFSQNWALAFKLPENTINALAKLKSSSVPLSFYFPEISQGLIAYDKYQGQSEDIISSRAYHFSSYAPGLKKWLWGEDVRKYQVNWNHKEYIDYCDKIANPRQPKYFKGRRMLIREITNPSIFAAISSEELYNDPAILIVLDSEYSLEAVTMILNSKIGTFYHFNASPKATKGDFPKILVKDIKDFPLPNDFGQIDKTFWRNFYTMAEFVAGSGTNTQSLDAVIDCSCLELYFSDYIKERSINILDLVAGDVSHEMKGREFGNIRVEEKEQVITNLKIKWSNPDNDVRNRIKLFAVRSPDVLKPILES